MIPPRALLVAGFEGRPRHSAQERDYLTLGDALQRNGGGRPSTPHVAWRPRQIQATPRVLAARSVVICGDRSAMVLWLRVEGVDVLDEHSGSPPLGANDRTLRSTPDPHHSTGRNHMRRFLGRVLAEVVSCQSCTPRWLKLLLGGIFGERGVLRLGAGGRVASCDGICWRGRARCFGLPRQWSRSRR